jgi:cellulose synthase/poly-beta-1,6-N-acetylglucosamine synthase-like glycosyltransferase
MAFFDGAMSYLFWAALLLIVYAYAGYPVWLRGLAAARRLPVRPGSDEPTVSVVIAAHNEQVNLPGKLRNLSELDYPRERLEIVVVSDGSTDETAEILGRAEGSIVAVILPEARGKAVALNQAVRVSKGKILVFFDTRQMVDADVLRQLCSCFADPGIGAVSGELLLVDAEGRPAGDALGLYWRIEKIVRRLESASGSVVGVTGAIYAMRRELWTDLPEDTILDDVLVPMNVARAGKRVTFQPAAIARDRVQGSDREFARKVRTLTGNYQLLRLAPWLLTPSNPLLFRFVSHKLLRLAVPFLLAILLASSACAHGLFYKAAFAAQLIFYGLAGLGWITPAMRRFRLVSVAETFTMLNVAAAVAFYNFAAGRDKVWV